MEPVISVNLAGNAYQLETSAHQALKAYLDRASAALADNPDKAEIIRDLEQAVADKASACLSAYKSVVGAQDMAAILEEMGPVEDERQPAPDESAAPSDDDSMGAPKKRLYRIREGAMVSGVCAGLGAYFALDANIIRILFVVATFFTGGFAILAYIAMMFLIPSAHTSAEWAAAHGIPSSAQEIIDQAKRNFAEFTGPESKVWRWRYESRRAWRQEMRARARAYARSAPPLDTGPLSWVTRVFGGVFAIVFSLLGAALLIAFLFALFSLVTAGAVLDWSLPASVPLWFAIAVLCVAYGALSGPVGALQGAAYSALSGRPRDWPHHGEGGGFAFLLVAAIVSWALYHNVPGFQAWADPLIAHLRALGQSLLDAF
jgi:phage shock protein PspC (stress-responsive transcriptional regulator)